MTPILLAISVDSRHKTLGCFFKAMPIHTTRLMFVAVVSSSAANFSSSTGYADLSADPRATTVTRPFFLIRR